MLELKPLSVALLANIELAKRFTKKTNEPFGQPSVSYQSVGCIFLLWFVFFFFCWAKTYEFN